jgi:hypothetical protein
MHFFAWDYGDALFRMDRQRKAEDMAHGQGMVRTLTISDSSTA